MARPQTTDPAYVTVVGFPDGMTQTDAVDFVAAATSTEHATVRLRLAKPPPVIIGLVPDAAASIDLLTEHGFDVFANTLADLAALGPTLKIRDLRLSDAGIEVDLWRGPGAVIRREDVRVLVRAGVHKKETKPVRPQRPLPPPGLHTPRSLIPAFEPAPAERPLLVRSDKLDIHTADGRVFQIDGDKFGYGILGDLKGYGDRTNMDSMCALLAHVTPNEIVDEYFPLWRPPPGFERLRLPEMKINKDDPAFAFYSRWTALLYRHMSGGW